jgi:hypothetical protein
MPTTSKSKLPHSFSIVCVDFDPPQSLMELFSVHAKLVSADDGQVWTFTGAPTQSSDDGSVAASMRSLLAQIASVREQTNTALTTLVAAQRARAPAPVAVADKRRRVDSAGAAVAIDGSDDADDDDLDDDEIGDDEDEL